MKKLIALSMLVLSAITLNAQNINLRDTLATVDKWSADATSTLFALKADNSVTAVVPATVKDAEKGIFSAKVGNSAVKKAERMIIVSPAPESNTIDDGKIKYRLSPVQDGDCTPIRFGTFAKPASKTETGLCDFASRNACFRVKLSSRSKLLQGWTLDKITLVSEEGIISGDALLDVKKGRLTPDKNGLNCNYVSFVPEKGIKVGSEYTLINLRVIPCNNLHGKKFRLDYTFSRDGGKMVICHDVVGMNLYESYTYTLEERIPEVIAGRWHMAEYPGENWEEVAPETMGYSSEKLEALRKHIEKDYTTTSMMVVVGGKVIFSMGDIEEPVRIASCRKSLISMLYGKYVENGTVNLEATLEELGIDDKGGLLPIEKQATVRNLLTARSGVYHLASNDGDDTEYAPARGSVQPGTYYLYNNWDFNCLGGIFEKLTGKDIYDAFMEDIAIPVGMQDYKIDNQHKTGITDPTLSNFLAYHFWLSTRDMARIAYLMLHNGQWNGTQVISEDWIKTTTSVFTPRAEMNPKNRLSKEFDYGYLWWVFSKEFKNYDPSIYGGGYTATGSGGQYITVLPALDMVIAHKDKTERSSKSKYYVLISEVAACRQ